MALTLNKRVWVLAERLYIHTHADPNLEHGAQEFIQFLKQFNTDYPGEPYQDFGTIKGTYTFMSEDNYTFADFMQLIPTYKYLPILEKIIFASHVTKTQRDNWNYYGEYIKNWYPELLSLLKLAGVNIDTKPQRLTYEEAAEKVHAEDFLPNEFCDPFLDYMRKEVNESYKHHLYLSVMFLSRKILEAIVIRIFEVVFPKLVNRQYTPENHELWYNKDRGQYHNFGTLLDNLKDKAGNLHEDKALILEIVYLVKPFKKETNACVHSDYKIPDEAYIRQWKIPHLISMARKVFRKYCNP